MEMRFQKQTIKDRTSKVSSTSKNNIHFVNVYDVCDLEYAHFFQEYMIKNIPCVIKNVTNQWGGLKWVFDNKPDFEFLTQSFGDAVVPVANCGSRFYNSQKKEEQTLKDYLSYWQDYIQNNYEENSPCLYLKDWHFTRDFPDERIYNVPKFFTSDWLNEYFSTRKDVNDDYRFVYMGPKGSWTPLHADVFSSYSWSVNLCGKKRWVLYPPGEEKCLTDKSGNLVYDIESPLLQNSREFENYDKLETSFEIIQDPGEAIFVPSGWHHQVWNLDDTISINHNWVNGCNIDKMWISLKENLRKVKLEISDCEDMEGWHQHCQTMLNAVYGLDYQQFCEFLLYIMLHRIKHLTTDNCSHLPEFLPGSSHFKFDLLQAKNILLELKDDCDFVKLSYFSKSNSMIMNVLQKADNILCDKYT